MGLLKKFTTFFKKRAFYREFVNFSELQKKTDARFRLSYKDAIPCLFDKTEQTQFDRHYVYHTAWAARILKKIDPKHHVDISSSVYFSSILSAFYPIDFYDYRPADIQLSNLKTCHADINKLPFEDSSVSSISCMHVIEHIGLGRYGDALDPDGDLKAFNELKRVVSDNGSLIIVIPMGEQPIVHFNAHRVYDYDQIIRIFHGFELMEFALIPEAWDNGGLLIDADKKNLENETYACGCFWFTKKAHPCAE